MGTPRLGLTSSAVAALTPRLFTAKVVLIALLKDSQLYEDAQSNHSCCMTAAEVPPCEVVLREQHIFLSLHCHVGITTSISWRPSILMGMCTGCCQGSCAHGSQALRAEGEPASRCI